MSILQVQIEHLFEEALLQRERELLGKMRLRDRGRGLPGAEQAGIGDLGEIPFKTLAVQGPDAGTGSRDEPVRR